MFSDDDSTDRKAFSPLALRTGTDDRNERWRERWKSDQNTESQPNISQANPLNDDPLDETNISSPNPSSIPKTSSLDNASHGLSVLIALRKGAHSALCILLQKLEEEVFMALSTSSEIMLGVGKVWGLEVLKKFLVREYEIKDLGALRYFLSMEFARSKKVIFVSQRKYVLDLLEEIDLVGCKLVETPVEPILDYTSKCR
ncbi:hypothetical protein CK203_039749 [Vitis vinifera]|uniref:Reverse transcriptase Ty1/copia-type domain-containing protein n=1 Tax=Vitis vinifera TaxID=29760 RepID=A0A438HTT1_VITVI|nr:hypothetical protein CK203_039749 [Vitis vinifera]